MGIKKPAHNNVFMIMAGSRVAFKFSFLKFVQFMLYSGVHGRANISLRFIFCTPYSRHAINTERYKQRPAQAHSVKW